MVGEPLLINRQNQQLGTANPSARGRQDAQRASQSSDSSNITTKGATFDLSAQIGNINRKIEERINSAKTFGNVKGQAAEIETLYKKAKEFGPRFFNSRTDPLSEEETAEFNAHLKIIDDLSYEGPLPEEASILEIAEDLDPDLARDLEVYSVDELSPAVRNVPQLSAGSMNPGDAARYVKAIDDALEVTGKRKQTLAKIERQADKGAVFESPYKNENEAAKNALRVGQDIASIRSNIMPEPANNLLRSL